MTQKKDIKEEMQKLIKVQEIDAQKFDLQVQLESFPGKIKDMDDLLNAKSAETENTGEELKRLQVLRNEKESEMQAKEEKINKHRTDLYQIKSNKEYTALQQEIKSIEADVSLLEEEIIGYLDKIEEVRIQSEKEKKAFEEESQKLEKEKEKIKSDEKQFLERLSEINALRAEAAAKIEPSIFAVYERILKNRGKVALTTINGNFCGACNMQLRPQIVNDAKLQKNIVSCENCGRMLYAEN